MKKGKAVGEGVEFLLSAQKRAELVRNMSQEEAMTLDKKKHLRQKEQESIKEGKVCSARLKKLRSLLSIQESSRPHLSAHKG